MRILCRDEVALIKERTALINQLQQALHQYYPTALEAFDDWARPAAWAFVGSDRSLYDDAQGLQCLAGTAPVSYQSGRIHKVSMRRGCNKHLRHAMYLFADKSRVQSAWAAK